MVNREFILSIFVGLGLFVTDFIFGWLTFLSSSIPVIFIMAIIIGIVAGNHGEAVLATMITWIGGILIGILIAPIIFAGSLNPDQTFLGLFLFVFFYSVRGFLSWQVEGNIIEVLVAGLLYLIVMLLVVPVLYLFSFAFAPLGVVIGKFIRGRVGGRAVEQKPVAHEPTVIPSTPVEEEPAEIMESTEVEEEYSDSSEN